MDLNKQHKSIIIIVKYSLYNCTTILGENVRYFMNKYDNQLCVCARRARLCVWIGLTNILFIDESMAV